MRYSGDMPEVLLKPNLRALVPVALALALLLLVGAALLVVAILGGGVLWYVLGGGLLAAGVFGEVAVWQWARQPRLGYEKGELLVYMRRGEPWRVPIDLVECFFLGQFPAAPEQAPGEVPAVAVIVRLAEKATDYHEREVQPALGRWHEGYITVRGNWSEPLSLERVKEMNAQLTRIHREWNETPKESSV